MRGWDIFFLIKDNVTDIEQRVVQESGRGVQENGESAMSRTDRQIQYGAKLFQ